ncbi:MAG: acyl-CoA dehydrogenase family protein [Alphaproteobacteria bacterium]|nr:acyl-CoA dehydrogenase family protein [Alphaproteobacteria bacterium]
MFELTHQQQDLQGLARSLAKDKIAAAAAETDRTEQYPWGAIDLFKDMGFMGMTIPKAYGGKGASYHDAVLVIEEIAKACGVCARIVVEANMGGIGAIMAYGTETQKRLAAELVLNGDKPAICITEPEAGSAATEMTTTAVKKGDTYVINGTKHWITGGGVSRLHVVFARVIEDGEDKGIGGFLMVRGETPGLEIGERIYAMGLRGIPETVVHFNDVEVGADMALLDPNDLKRGFARLMDAYNAQRVGAGTVALGIAEGAHDHAVQFVQEREQFGRPIAEFQGLQWMLADMSIELAAAQALIYKAASSAGPAGFPDQMLAAQAKIKAAEVAIKVTNDALQLHGAAGYSRANPLERMLRDARMFTIGGGTAQILRNVVASKLLDRKLPQTRDGYLR